MIVKSTLFCGLIALQNISCQPPTATTARAVESNGGTEATPAPAMTPRPLPKAMLQSVDGSPQDIDGLRAGKPALITFWATWCDSCLKEFDALNRLDDRAKSQSAMVIGIAVGEPSSVANPFAKAHGLKYALLFDEQFKLADALGQRQVPATLVLDRQGRIIYSGNSLDAGALRAFTQAVNTP